MNDTEKKKIIEDCRLKIQKVLDEHKCLLQALPAFVQEPNEKYCRVGAQIHIIYKGEEDGSGN